MGLERELKFSLVDAPPSFDELRGAFGGSPFRLIDEGTRLVRDRYFDDDARSLRRAGVALRRRLVGGVEVATLKTQGTVRGALHEREEVEGRLEDGRWPAHVLARLRALVRGGPEALAPIVELSIERTAYPVHGANGPIAVLTFDDVTARTASSDRDAMFREAELEAVGDTDVETLERVVERVSRVVTLAPSAVNKLDRAEAVLLLGASL